jgi:microcompartment protein CcmL/EutN
MPQSAPIKDSESIAVIEVTGAINLARLLQSIGSDTRARLIGATEASAAGTITVVIAGGLAEVQHANSQVKELAGVTDSAFFAKPERTMIDVLLKSLKLAEAPETKVLQVEERKEWKQRVRTADELDITDIKNWNVHELRRYARSVSDFPLHGREISKATRGELLAMIVPKHPSSILYPSTQVLPS